VPGIAPVLPAIFLIILLIIFLTIFLIMISRKYVLFRFSLKYGAFSCFLADNRYNNHQQDHYRKGVSL